jgi:hypothetical protein
MRKLSFVACSLQVFGSLTLFAAAYQTDYEKQFNGLKIKALGTFENRGWLSPPAWAVLAGFYPIRAGYSYLKRLWKWKLLDRSLDTRGLLLYRMDE